MTQSTEHTRNEAAARGGRLGQQDYFDVGLDILGKQGHEALTIAVLCEVLDVSKGSFYHHFGGWPGFMEALLTYWEQISAVQVAEMASRVDDPHARSGLLRNMGLVINHDAEAAIRVWARSEPVAEQVQERVDKSRVEVLTDLIALRLPRPDARRLAELAHVAIVGTQMTSRPFSHQVMLRQFKLLDSLIEARYKAHVFF